MAGETPTEAYQNFRGPMEQALRCITPGRLTVPKVSRFELNREYGIVLNGGEPIDLRGAVRFRFSAGQTFRIVHTDDVDRGPYKVRTVRYQYVFEAEQGREVLVFHWAPETRQPGERSYPHLHVGSVMIAGDAPILPDRFHKLHVPTSRVSVEAVVRFAIEELGVTGKRGWERVLERTQTAFETWRTRAS